MGAFRPGDAASAADRAAMARLTQAQNAAIKLHRDLAAAYARLAATRADPPVAAGIAALGRGVPRPQGYAPGPAAKPGLSAAARDRLLRAVARELMPAVEAAGERFVWKRPILEFLFVWFWF
jgi:hypothetical protein